LNGFFTLKYAILSFGKYLNNYISGFQRGDNFLKCDDTDGKIHKNIFSLSERHS